MTVRHRFGAPALVVVALVSVLASLLAVATAPPAAADARVTVTNVRGGRDADLRYRTTLTVQGSGFQVVKGGFGGVYVMFGWVDDPRGGSWKPSRGGLTGQDYRYVPDAEDAADNQGYLKFVAFPGSSTAGEAATVLRADGTFRVETTVPGPVFQSVDRNGEVAEVDCRAVTCGVITIGAHGVKNPENETFTPVSFGSVFDEAPVEQEQPPASVTDSDNAPTVPDDAAAAPPAKATGRARQTVSSVAVDRTTAVAGHALTFTARGFTPGEQVVAVLDDGAAGLGPMLAGTSGEIAGVLQLPAGTGVGTHELRLTGAASGTEVSELFPVAAGLAPQEPGDDAAPATSEEGGGPSAGALFLAVAVLLFLVALVAFLLRRRRSRAVTA